MPKMYYDQDARPERLAEKTVAVLGYGSQGHAHALNLRDSGVDVVVGLHPGSCSRARAEADGLRVLPVAGAVAAADVVMVLIPDTKQARVYADEIEPNLRPGQTLMFAHGFNVRFAQIVCPDFVDVSMVAPKAPGHRVRELYVEGQGTPALVAVEQDASGGAWDDAVAYAHGIGCTRAGVIATTFAEETETDLFGEQAVLCGGVSALVQAGFETLTRAGYQPEVAYFECLHELKLIVDLMYEGGISYMFYSVSDTAEHGGYTGGERLVTEATRAEMRAMLAEIRDGTYAANWVAENKAGRPWFDQARARSREQAIEEVGRKLRALMPFLKSREIPREVVA